MSALFDNDAAKIASATLTDTTITATMRRLMIVIMKPISVDTLDIVAELSNSSNLIQNLNLQDDGVNVFSEGFFTPDSFTTEAVADINSLGTGSWQVVGVGMPANSNGASLEIKHYRNASTATATVTGTADTGNMMFFAIGHGFFPPNMKVVEAALFLTASQAEDDSIFSAIYNGGAFKRPDAIGSIKRPAYHWRLKDDFKVNIGSPDLSNAGSITFDSDNPTLIGPVEPIHRVSAGANGAGTTSTTVTIPATVQAGDVLYLTVTSRDHTSGTGKATVSDNDTGGNAWAEMASSTNRKGYVFWKRATSGTAGKTITVSGGVGSTCATVSAYYNVIESGNPYANASAQDNTSGTESHSGFTPSNNNSMICLSVCDAGNDTNTITSPQTATSPGALTQRSRAQSTGGSDCAATHLSAPQVGSAGATGNFTWSQTNAVTASIVWAIPPEVTVSASATAAQTLPGIDQAASGALQPKATAAQSLPRIGQSAAAKQSFTAAAAQTLAGVEQSGSAAQIFTATAAQALASIEQSASGSHAGASNAAAVAQTLPGIDQAAVAVEHPRGAGAQSLPSVDQAAVAKQTFTATAAQALPSIDQAGSGREHPRGAAAQTLASVDQAASAKQTFTATAAQTLASVDQAASGREHPRGAGVQTLASVDQAAFSSNDNNGAASQALPGIDQAASAALQPKATAAQTLAGVDQSASAKQTFTATAAQALSKLRQAASSTIIIPGAAAALLPGIEQAATGLEHPAATADMTLPAVVQAAIATAVRNGDDYPGAPLPRGTYDPATGRPAYGAASARAAYPAAQPRA